MNQSDYGTPDSIDELLTREMTCGPLDTFFIRMKSAFRDYLAQRFQAAMYKAHTPEQEALLEELWFSITGERLKK